MSGVVAALLGAGGAGGGGGLTLTAAPISAVGSGNNPGAIAVTSNEVAVSVAGGTAPYAYAWTTLTVGTVISILSPTAAATRFRATLAAGDAEYADFRCTVTDAGGRTGTADVSASLFNFWARDPI